MDLEEGRLLGGIVSYVAGISFIIIVYSAPAMALVVWLAEVGKFQKIPYYAILGFLNGAIVPIYVQLMFHIRVDWSFVIFGAMFGPISGFIYWRIAGRNAGLWRKPLA